LRLLVYPRWKERRKWGRKRLKEVVEEEGGALNHSILGSRKRKKSRKKKEKTRLKATHSNSIVIQKLPLVCSAIQKLPLVC
jgi:hypothetical protein